MQHEFSLAPSSKSQTDLLAALQRVFPESVEGTRRYPAIAFLEQRIAELGRKMFARINDTVQSRTEGNLVIYTLDQEVQAHTEIMEVAKHALQQQYGFRVVLHPQDCLRSCERFSLLFKAPLEGLNSAFEKIGCYQVDILVQTFGSNCFRYPRDFCNCTFCPFFILFVVPLFIHRCKEEQHT